MITMGTLWTYAIPCLVALLALGAVLSTVNHEPPGTHRAPRGHTPAIASPVEHIGATETTTAEDYAAPADPLGVLDTSPDSVEAWLAQWHADYLAELQHRADLDEPSDPELIEETDAALRHVQEVCEDIAARLTSVAEAAVFDWRINTPTGELPIVQTPAAQRLLVSALLES